MSKGLRTPDPHTRAACACWTPPHPPAAIITSSVLISARRMNRNTDYISVSVYWERGRSSAQVTNISAMVPHDGTHDMLEQIWVASFQWRETNAYTISLKWVLSTSWQQV